MQLIGLPLSEIDFQDETYLLSPSPRQHASPTVLASIKRVGILHPPLLVKAESGRYRILSGRNRLLAACRLHFTSCDCRVVPSAFSPLETLTLLIEEVIAKRPPTLMEQAIFLKKAEAWLDSDEVARRFLPILGHQPHPSQVGKLLRLNNLEEVIQEAVHHGQLDVKVAWELEKLAFVDRMALFEIIMALRLSVANQKKVTLISREVAMRTKSSIAAFLARSDSQEILNSSDLNPPQKSSHFMAWLQQQQFPRLSRAEEEFRAFCRTLKLPSGASLQHAPFFEKDELTLTLRFANRQELLEKMPELMVTQDDPK